MFWLPPRQPLLLVISGSFEYPKQIPRFVLHRFVDYFELRGTSTDTRIEPPFTRAGAAILVGDVAT